MSSPNSPHTVESGHTPGPWQVRRWSRKMNVSGNLHQITDSEGYPSAFVPAWDAPEDGEVDGTEEAKANARLIAAAPELLDALCLAHDHLAPIFEDMEGSATGPLVKIREVIAKATKSRTTGEN